jgi:hypothetical protein
MGNNGQGSRVQQEKQGCWLETTPQSRRWWAQ